MLSECPQCGQKLRPQWARCPRCRILLPDALSTDAVSAAGTSAPSPRGPLWIAAGIGLVILALVTVFVTRQQPPPSAVVPVSTAPQEAPVAVPSEASAGTFAGGESDPVLPSTTFEALDAKRAGSVAYATGDFATALAQMEAAVASAPGDAGARNNLGQLLVRNGRASEALPHFDEAVRLDGEKWDYRFNRARTFGLLDRWSEAVAEYRVAAQLFPDDHATLYNLGLALMRVRDFTAAASTLERAVAMAPEQHDFLITLGTAYVGASQNDRARAAFEKFLELEPNDPEAAKVKALLQAFADAGS
jgi:Flp pilus assembly protein TadD